MIWRVKNVHCSGGSRIFPGGGANSQKCYYFSIFCRKLHENERIWTPRGGRASLAPPLGSANALLLKDIKRNISHFISNTIFLPFFSETQTTNVNLQTHFFPHNILANPTTEHAYIPKEHPNQLSLSSGRNHQN